MQLTTAITAGERDARRRRAVDPPADSPEPAEPVVGGTGGCDSRESTADIGGRV
jgi:hypothetical protein